MNDKHRLGQKAETEIAQRLISNGFKILARNYRCATGEIDIVAESGDLVVFMEVRSESTGYYGDPAMTVTAPKQRRIASAAQHWLLGNPRPTATCVLTLLAFRRGRKVAGGYYRRCVHCSLAEHGA